ncbi:MAG TPA: class I SAM-dependent methyltransferase [Burkholderiaceae bacterium]|nr:class I SAM-dependent methyltransferase [Burkholderiaceae bacterium]
MINFVNARLHRPERGWDPIPPSYAADYSNEQWSTIDHGLLDDLEKRVGGFAGKTILDLGGGPAHYALAMAQRGGIVTWHDVSSTYLELARRKADEFGLQYKVRFSLGYLDEAPQILSEQFDFVFNRICWNYGFADRSFAAVLYSMVKPGGFAYVDTTHSGFKRDQLPTLARMRTWLNDHTGIKIGHPLPPHGRLARLFLAFAVKRMTIDYRSPTNDRIFFEKADLCE